MFLMIYYKFSYEKEIKRLIKFFWAKLYSSSILFAEIKYSLSVLSAYFEYSLSID